MFVGFVQEPYGAPCTRIREPETPSLSLHSSPSSVLGSLCSSSPSDPSSPRNHADPRAPVDGADKNQSHGGVSPAASPLSDGDLQNSEELTEEDSPCHNNNKDRGTDPKQRLRYRRGDGVDLLALYNHPPLRQGQVKYYTVKVPLRVQNYDEGVRGVEANWLDHMTQHFNNGASLVDGYFHLGNVNELLPKSVESVFIFQEATESEPNVVTPTYDAIVVEQWTIIDGLQVKADYVPLLQSLATYGWRLTCVLPTPVIKTNSDGSLSTKQIVFLQRPVLNRKRKESKKLIFKPRSKSNKNCIKETAKSKKKKTTTEKDAEDSKILNDREKKEDDKRVAERGSAAQTEAAGGGEEERKKRCDGDKKIDGGIEAVSKEDGGAESEDVKVENQAEEEEKITVDGEGSKGNGEPSGNEEVKEVKETVVTVETQSEGGEERLAEVQSVMENGIETEREEDEGEEDQIKAEEPAEVEVITKESVADPRAAIQNPAEAQE
ncbi:raftlin [Austrofundulus limnaeus]|nr:PREDICTED: raftlin-like [Austrofundulus limnaeus]